MRLSQLLSEFLSTPSGWRATISIPPVYARGVISIHALRVEGDLNPLFPEGLTYIISIHALRVEGDGIIRGQARKD